MIVGVVAGRSERSTGIYTSYLDAILGVGGSPVIIAPSDGYKNLDDILGILDCLLLAGGGDIEPRQYKQAATASLECVDPVRDEIELWAATSMRATGKRILGICRGAQLLAVAAGGSLIQDLPAAGMNGHCAFHATSTYASARHLVTAHPNSLADHVLHGLRNVNSQHHQGIQQPGHGLRVTAWSPDGTAEAIEGNNMLGLQWHPEIDTDHDNRNVRPFTWLVHGAEGLTP
jgi:putative glutamine amidotransferase